LKLVLLHMYAYAREVAPHAGAWIETLGETV